MLTWQAMHVPYRRTLLDIVIFLLSLLGMFSYPLCFYTVTSFYIFEGCGRKKVSKSLKMKDSQMYFQCSLEVTKQSQDKWLTDETYFKSIKA